MSEFTQDELSRCMLDSLQGKVSAESQRALQAHLDKDPVSRSRFTALERVYVRMRELEMSQSSEEQKELEEKIVKAVHKEIQEQNVDKQKPETFTIAGLIARTIKCYKVPVKTFMTEDGLLLKPDPRIKLEKIE